MMFGLAALWVLFLGGLTYWTANPVTLNRDQILLAQATGAVVVAEVIDAQAGRVRISDVLSVAEGLPVEMAIGNELFVPELTAFEVRTGDRVVLPLVPRIGRNEVVIAPTRGGSVQAYPAETGVVQDVKQLLAGR